MIKLFHHPAIKALRILQFSLAIIIFFYAALAPIGDAQSNINPLLLHFTGNLLLILSAWMALSGTIKLKYLFVLCLLLSGSSELAQSLTSSRITDPVDFLSNIAGLSFGLIMCYLAQLFFYPSPLQLE